MKVKFSLSIGFNGAEHTSVEEYPDDATDDQIEQDYLDWRNNYLDGGWWRVESDEDDE